MSLLQLQSLVAIAEERSISGAARRLRVSQPPLTRRLRALEDELGVQLFERLPRGVRLLDPGRRLVEHARRILADVEVAARAARSAGVSAQRVAARSAGVPVSRRSLARGGPS